MMGQLCTLRLLLVILFVFAGTIAELLQPCKELLQNECVLDSPTKQRTRDSHSLTSASFLLLNGSQALHTVYHP